MKKIIALLLCALLLAGCTGNEQPEATIAPDTTEAPVHVHESNAQWDRNGEEHWQICECGEKLNAGEHELKDDVCTVCGSVIWDDDGLKDVYNYNEHGDMTRWSIYDGGGAVSADWSYEHEYENGALVKTLTYESGVLLEEADFDTASGNPSRTVSHLDDGSWVVEIYDSMGGVIGMVRFAPDGTMEAEECYDDAYLEEWDSRAALEVERYSGGNTN